MSMIVIRSATVTPRTIRRKDGTQMVFREQAAAIQKDGEDFPQPFRLTLDQEQAPYPAGNYTVDASSFTTGEFGDLRVGRRVVLVPIAAAPAATTKAA